jgi:dolichol-phosphate mannosyltransferase
MKLTAVIPVHNEEEVIGDTLARLESELTIPHEVVVVNDHSTDRTVGVVKDAMAKWSNIRLVDNEFPPGFTNALKTGFSSVDEGAIVTVMGDLCDDIGTIEKMYGKIQEGYDVVCGSRYMKGGRKIGGRFLQGVFSKFVGLSLHWLTGIPTHDVSNAFKMYRHEVVTNMNIEEAGFASSLEITVKAYVKSFRITEVPTAWHGRTKGQSDFRILRVSKNYLRWYVWALLLRNWKC